MFVTILTVAGTYESRVPKKVNVMHSDVMSRQSHTDNTHRHEMTKFDTYINKLSRSQPPTAQTQTN